MHNLTGINVEETFITLDMNFNQRNWMEGDKKADSEIIIAVLHD